MEELLTGARRPIGARELLGWEIYHARQAQRQELAAKMAQGALPQ